MIVKYVNEIWTATASQPIHEGDLVRVVAVQGLLLTVSPEKVGQPAASQQYHA